MSTTSVIVAGARTPVGRFLGSLSGMSAAELGGLAISAALSRARVPAEMVKYVVMGQVLSAGAGQLPARQASVAAGIPMTVPAMSINKVCLSGLDAIAFADQLIRAGVFDTVVAGGQESMSQAPHLLRRWRIGTKLGDATLTDHLAHDGLHYICTDQSMGALTDTTSASSREEQDEFAATSHQRSATAWERGLFDDEIVPVQAPRRGGGQVLVDRDECIRADTTVESLSKLKPVFTEGGTVTAGNASPINDGAAAVVVMNKDKATALGLDWLVEIGPFATVAGPDSSLQLQPANALVAACDLAGASGSELDLVEINEAFAAVGVESSRALGLDDKRVNVNGGAIAIGHPLGMSGARITLHLALELRRSGGGTGAAALCGGGGQGSAMILTNTNNA